MAKKLIMVNGTMCVGKTETCKALNKKIYQSAWLDGDWCWVINPFIVNDENIEMVENNISFLLKQYLSSTSINNVIFSWVMHRESIFDSLVSKLNECEFDLFKISLVCSEDILKERVRLRGEYLGDIESRYKACIERLPLYFEMDTIKVDTSQLSPEQAADKIIEIIN